MRAVSMNFFKNKHGIHTKQYILILISVYSLLCNSEEYAVTLQESAYFLPQHDNPSAIAEVDANFWSDAFDFRKHFDQTDADAKCQPRQIHLSLGNTQHQDLSKVGMTVSFSMPYRLDYSCHPSRTQIMIQYGIVGEETTFKKMIGENYDQDEDVVIRQYDAVSPLTKEKYESDFIYHISLNNLEGSTDYWYSISTSLDQPFAHPLAETKRNMMDNSESKGHRNENLLENGKINLDQVRQPQRHLRYSRNSEAAQIHPMVFRTAPTKASKHKPIKFAIVGDLGQTYNSTKTMMNILASTHTHPKAKNPAPSPVTALLIAGDMSYANSIQPQWDNWFNLVEPIAQKIPIMVTAGNHEIECDDVTHMPFTAYENRFYMPNRLGDAVIKPVESRYWNYSKWGCATPSVFIGDYDYGNAYYSFDYGFVKVVVLSSYSDTKKGSNQYKWLLEELKNTNREDTPWLVIMMHNQLYTTFKAHNGEEETNVMRESMEHLFKEYKVNLIFSGHDHAYMRSKPMHRMKVDESGESPIYLIVGEGGNREEHVKGYLSEDPEQWVAVRDRTVYGFGTLEFANETHANWKWIMDENDTGAKFEDDVWFEHQYKI